jgi:hypothetical protein
MKFEHAPEVPNSKEMLQRFFVFVSREMPEGVSGHDLSYPVRVGENELNAVIFGLDGGKVTIGLFIREGTFEPAKTIAGLSGKYSRKSLQIDQEGDVNEDPVGTVPEFDLTSNEPDFSGMSDEVIAVEVVKQIIAYKHPQSH